MPDRPVAPGAAQPRPQRASDRLARLIAALGFAPSLAVLAGVATRADATGALIAAAAAVATIASAWWTLTALRRAGATDAPPPATPPGTRDADAAAVDAQIQTDHKVRNTLQIVASLLDLELRRAGPSGERAALLRVQSRLHSLALVHRRCSAVDADAALRLDLLVGEIAEQLIAERSSGREAIEVRLALDPVAVAPERATAFALFVTEALVNARDNLAAATHAGPIALSLRAAGAGACLLSIRNPTGPIVAAPAGHRAVGARLMANCAEQLGATLTAGRDGDAYEVRLAMPLRPGA